MLKPGILYAQNYKIPHCNTHHVRLYASEVCEDENNGEPRQFYSSSCSFCPVTNIFVLLLITSTFFFPLTRLDVSLHLYVLWSRALIPAEMFVAVQRLIIELQNIIPAAPQTVLQWNGTARFFYWQKWGIYFCWNFLFPNPQVTAFFWNNSPCKMYFSYRIWPTESTYKCLRYCKHSLLFFPGRSISQSCKH